MLPYAGKVQGEHVDGPPLSVELGARRDVIEKDLLTRVADHFRNILVYRAESRQLRINPRRGKTDAQFSEAKPCQRRIAAGAGAKDGEIGDTRVEGVRVASVDGEVVIQKIVRACGPRGGAQIVSTIGVSSGSVGRGGLVGNDVGVLHPAEWCVTGGIFLARFLADFLDTHSGIQPQRIYRLV